MLKKLNQEAYQLLVHDIEETTNTVLPFNKKKDKK
jgi:hypothetical protein